MAAHPGERILAAEMVAALALTWISDVSNRGAAPSPTQMMGQIMLYMALALVALLGASAAKLAAGLGGVVLVTIAMKSLGGVTTSAKFVAGGAGGANQGAQIA